jgi:hypothetical protein
MRRRQNTAVRYLVLASPVLAFKLVERMARRVLRRPKR